MKKGQIGIELGTKHIRVCTREKEQYVRIKNMIAIDGEANIRAVGNEAFRMYEKEPSNIQMIAPITSGVIGDYTNMRLLLAAVLRKYFRYFRKCTVDVAAPSDITGVEKRAFYDLVWESGRRLRDVRLVSKPMLAAIGSGLDVNAPCGNMIIDFGAGTTEISVISLGGIVKSRLLKFGGDQIDQWIVHKVRRLYNIDIGRRSAERLKLQYSKNEDEKQVVMKGRDLLSGLPGKITVPVSLAEEKVKSHMKEVAMEARAVLETVPPELAADIMVQGIFISGGSASFPKAGMWLEEELGISVYTVQQPEDTGIRGLSFYLDKKDGK